MDLANARKIERIKIITYVHVLEPLLYIPEPPAWPPVPSIVRPHVKFSDGNLAANRDRVWLLLVWPVNCFHRWSVNNESFQHSTWKINLKSYRVPMYMLSRQHSAIRWTKTPTGRHIGPPSRRYLPVAPFFPAEVTFTWFWFSTKQNIHDNGNITLQLPFTLVLCSYWSFVGRIHNTLAFSVRNTNSSIVSDL